MLSYYCKSFYQFCLLFICFLFTYLFSSDASANASPSLDYKTFTTTMNQYYCAMDELSIKNQSFIGYTNYLLANRTNIVPKDKTSNTYYILAAKRHPELPFDLVNVFESYFIIEHDSSNNTILIDGFSYVFDTPSNSYILNSHNKTTSKDQSYSIITDKDFSTLSLQTSKEVMTIGNKPRVVDTQTDISLSCSKSPPKEARSNATLSAILNYTPSL